MILVLQENSKAIGFLSLGKSKCLRSSGTRERGKINRHQDNAKRQTKEVRQGIWRCYTTATSTDRKMQCSTLCIVYTSAVALFHPPFSASLSTNKDRTIILDSCCLRTRRCSCKWEKGQKKQLQARFLPCELQVQPPLYRIWRLQS